MGGVGVAIDETRSALSRSLLVLLMGAWDFIILSLS